MEKVFVIPKGPLEPVSTEPKSMIIYSTPKAGKTSIVSKLVKSLIMEHEPNGAAALKARYINIGNPYEVMPFIDQIKLDPSVDILIVDTITKWDEWSETVGTYDYMGKPQGKKWNVIANEQLAHTDNRFQSVHEMGEGYGYRYSREVMNRWYKKITSIGKTVIFLAHVKDKFIAAPSNDIVQTIDINLTGKVKDIYSTAVDAIARFKRVGKQGFLVFESGGDAAAGSRYAYLSGTILISESDADGNLTTYWEKIFPSKYK